MNALRLDGTRYQFDLETRSFADLVDKLGCR